MLSNVLLLFRIKFPVFSSHNVIELVHIFHKIGVSRHKAISSINYWFSCNNNGTLYLKSITISVQLVCPVNSSYLKL